MDLKVKSLLRWIALALWIASPLDSAAAPRAAPATAPEATAKVLSRLVRGLITAPDSPALHYELGAAYYRQGAILQAEKEFAAAIELAKKNPRAAPPQADMLKGYLRAVRARRPLASELKLLQDLRKLTPRDPEVARWLIDVYIDNGEREAARTILLSFPQIKQNAEVLAKWIGVGGAAKRDGMREQEERFQDLVTLMEVGNDSHKTTAAGEILDLAARMPVATVSALQRKGVEKAFERLTAVDDGNDPAQALKIHQKYLALLDQWNMQKNAKSLILQMRQKFTAARADPQLLYRLARLHHQEGRTDEALTTIREAIHGGVEEGGARLMHATLLEKKGLTEEAVSEYAAALESVLTPPNRAEAMGRVEKWLEQAGQKSGLSESMDTLIHRLSIQMPHSMRLARLAREGAARTAIRLGRASEAGAAIQLLDAEQLRRLWDRWPTIQVGRRLLTLGETAAIRRWLSQQSSQDADHLSLAAELAVAEGHPQEAMLLYGQLEQKRGLTDEEERKFSFVQTRQEKIRAESLFSSGNFVEALDAYNGLSDSSAPQQILRRAACLAKINRAGEAVTLLEKAPMGDDLRIPRAALLASLYEQTQNSQRAEEVYQELRQAGTAAGSLEAARKLAGLFSSRERWADALPLLDRIVKEPGLSTDDKMAWVRGKIYTQNFSEADRIERMLRELVRDTPQAHTLLGQYESAIGNRDAAQAAFSAALRLDPQNEMAAMGLAGLVMEGAEANPGAAIEILTSLDQKSKLVSRMLARIFAQRGQWEMAAAWMEKAAESDQDKIQTAWYWFRAGQIEEASHLAPAGGLFEAVLDAEAGRFHKLKKTNPDLLEKVVGETEDRDQGPEKILRRWTKESLAAAKRRLEAGDREAALRMCDVILSRTQDPEAFYVKGITNLTLGLYDDAKDLLKKAAESPEWSVPANLKLGQLELIRGRPVDALRYLDHAGPGGDPSELIMAWGMALALSKSPEQGEQILRQISKKNIKGKFFLGRLMEEKGNLKEAMESYRAALRDDGNFVEARFRLGALAMASKDLDAAEQAFNEILRNEDAGRTYLELAASKLDEIRQITGNAR